MNRDSSLDSFEESLSNEDHEEIKIEDVFRTHEINDNSDYCLEEEKIRDETLQEIISKFFFFILDNSSKKSKRYKMHSIEIKRKCLEFAQVMPLKKVSETFDVPIKSLKRWMIVGAERKKGGGRKIRDPEMERKLYEWYVEFHITKKLPVTSRMIKNKALELTKLEDFNASKGWLEKIKKKYNLQISRSTTSFK